MDVPPNLDLVATLRPFARRAWERHLDAHRRTRGAEAIVQSAIENGVAWVRHGRIIRPGASNVARHGDPFTLGQLVLAVRGFQEVLIAHQDGLGELREFAQQVRAMDPKGLFLNLARELDGNRNSDDLPLVAGLDAVMTRLRSIDSARLAISVASSPAAITAQEQAVLDFALVITAFVGVSADMSNGRYVGMEPGDNRITPDMLGSRTLEALTNLDFEELHEKIEAVEVRYDGEGLTIGLRHDVDSQADLLQQCLVYCALNRGELRSAIGKDGAGRAELDANISGSLRLTRGFRVTPELRILSVDLGLNTSRDLS